VLEMKGLKALTALSLTSTLNEAAKICTHLKQEGEKRSGGGCGQNKSGRSGEAFCAEIQHRLEEKDESQSSEEFNFAVALQLRKNLAETFDKHVQSSNISEVIARFENSCAAASNKPPRQQKPTGTASKSTALGVYLRVRPVAGKDYAAATTLEIQPTLKATDIPTTVRTFPPVDSNATKVVRDSLSDQGGVKEFEFTQVFGSDSSQQQVYGTVAAPLVSGLFPSSSSKNQVGESALLFAYGITNAGKTHTIMGDIKEKESMGIIPRALRDIFAHMEERDPKYDLNLSYMEIYNEGIYD
jgi:Kinesin motor domain